MILPGTGRGTAGAAGGGGGSPLGETCVEGPLRRAFGAPPPRAGEDLELSPDRDRLDLPRIHGWLANTYWSPGIAFEVVERAIANSMVVGAYRGPEQVGFARLVTDRATFAYLADVYVAADARGQGLGRRLAGHFLAHPELQGLRRWMLATADAHGVYAALGFTPLAVPDRYMEIYNGPPRT